MVSPGQRFRARAATAFLAIAMAPALAGAQASADSASAVTGVVASHSGRPLSDATVEAVAFGRTRTDSAGRFRLAAMSTGTVLIRTIRLGYLPSLKAVQLAAGQTLDLAIVLDSAGTTLPAMTVRESATPSVGNLAGFEHRRLTAAGGRFFTAADIEKWHFSRVSQLFQGIAGVSVTRDGAVSIERGVTTLLGRACGSVQVLINGVLMPDGFSVNEIPATALRGAELYSGAATTPAELHSSRATCGTLALWTW